MSIAPPLGLRDDRFPLRGREALVGELAGVWDEREVSHARVLTGLGGCGKTSVALEVASRAVSRGVETWWISASSAARFQDGVHRLCRRLGITAAELGEGDAPDLLWQRLGRFDRRWLLVVDNADDLAVLDVQGRSPKAGTGWIRPVRSPLGMVLATSRDGDMDRWGPWWVGHPLNVLPDEDAVAVLLDRAGEAAGARAEALALAQRLGGLPLALRLAGGYLAHTNARPVEFAGEDDIRSYTGYRDALDRGRLTDLLPASGADTALTEDQARVLIDRTWELSVDLIERQGAARARPLLRLLSFLADAPVPYRTVLDADQMSGSALFNGIGGQEIWTALQALSSVGLIEMDGPGQDGSAEQLRLHLVVRDANRTAAETEGQTADYLEAAVALVKNAAKKLGFHSLDPSDWRHWRLLAPHCVHLLESVSGPRAGQATDSVLLDAARAAHGCANYFWNRGLLQQAEELCQNVLAVRRRLLEPDHRSLLASRHLLAHIAGDQGRLAESEAEHRAVLDVEIRTLGADHEDARATRLCLTEQVSSNGRNAEAEAEMRELLRLEADARGAEDLLVLKIRHKLAHVEERLGRLAEAEEGHRAVLEIERRTLGDEHRATLSTRYCLAGLLRTRGRYAEAEDEYRAVLETEERVLGELHPNTLATRHYLATVLNLRGRTREAETEYTTVVAARRRLLGDEHRETLRTRHQLGHALHQQGKLAEAEDEHRAVIEVQARALGHDHPETLQTRHCLAGLLRERNEFAEAEREYRDILERCRRALGDRHPNVFSTWHQLGHVLAEQGKHAEAMAEHRALLAAETELRGERHPDTLGTRHCIAALQRTLGELDAAENEARAVIGLYADVLDAQHPATLTARTLLAQVLQDRGLRDESEAELRAVLKAQEQILGPEHATTRRTRESLQRLAEPDQP